MKNRLTILSDGTNTRYIRLTQENDGTFTLNDSLGSFKPRICHRDAIADFNLCIYKARLQDYKITKRSTVQLTKAQIQKHDKFFSFLNISVDSSQLNMF